MKNKLISNSKLIILILFSILFFQNNVSAQKKQKVDGVAAVVGDYMILDSDIDLMYMELQSQGMDVSKITRCELLGKQMEDKLFAHQAIQDSIVVTDEEVNSFMNDQFNRMVEQVGSPEKVYEYYKKKDEQDFKAYFFDVIKLNKLTSQMQRKIVDGITITPEEVKQFYNKIPTEEMPLIGAEIEIAQLVCKPVISKEDKQKVIDKLNEIKKDVIGGSSFFGKAVIYSEDPGSSSNGGYYKMNKKTQFVKEFKEVAFRLKEGEVSEPFETEFGYHIIMVDKILGQDIELRHILISPKPTSSAISEALDKIEKVKAKIEAKEISFSDAVKASSDDKETRNNGGVILNPRTSEPIFEISKLDPELYNQVNTLNEGEISKIITEQDKQTGKAFKIYHVNKKTDEHKADFSKDYQKIKEMALNEKQFKEIAKWMDSSIEKNYIKVNNDYKNCEFSNNWLKK